jgi:ABC-2 type transport system ATP-binding protein
MLQIKNITIKYNNNIILENFSYYFEENKMYLLKGTNGSGKTSLMNIIYNIKSPSYGDLIFKGLKIESGFQEIKTKINLFHTNGKYLVDDLTVNEYINFYVKMKYMSKTDIKYNIYEILKSLGFNSNLNEAISKLSTGTKMKLSLACTLSGHFDLILLDEPFANIDSGSVSKLIGLIKQINTINKTSFIISSHENVESILTFDNTIYLNK